MDRSFLNGLDLGTRPLVAMFAVVVLAGMAIGAVLTAAFFWLAE